MEELKIQLNQLYGALEVAGEEEKVGIQKLIQDLKEVIELSSSFGEEARESLKQLEEKGNYEVPCSSYTASNQSGSNGQILDHDYEFAKFQKEIDTLDKIHFNSEDNKSDQKDSSRSSSEEKQENEDGSTNIRELLADLEGMKCKAPFEHHWGQQGHHNAIVFSAEPIFDNSNTNPENGLSSFESVAVRVIFAQPRTEGMRPCQFYLEGRCRFSEVECKFSHGELVALSHLKDYKEPNFSAVTCGKRVLAKYSDELWYNATVSKLTESGDCEITYDAYNEKAILPLHDTFPLDYEEDELSVSSDSSNSDDETDLEYAEQSQEVWQNMRGTSALGEWEKHTKGFGSKLMQKMGYVLGTGLGKDGEGRVEPVDAVILPPGRSLDRCMELKENAGSAGANLFSVERRLKRMKKKETLRAEQSQEKARKNESLFNFLNSHLNLSKNSKQVKKNKPLDRLNKDSALSLNKRLLSIGENIKQVKKDIVKCKEGMKRHEGRDKSTVELMKLKLNALEAKLSDLKCNEVTVTSEQKNRSDNKKLLVF